MESLMPTHPCSPLHTSQSVREAAGSDQCAVVGTCLQKIYKDLCFSLAFDAFWFFPFLCSEHEGPIIC